MNPSDILIQKLREALKASHPINIDTYKAELIEDDVTVEVEFTSPLGGTITFFNVYWDEETGEPLQYEVGIST